MRPRTAGTVVAGRGLVLGVVVRKVWLADFELARAHVLHIAVRTDLLDPRRQHVNVRLGSRDLRPHVLGPPRGNARRLLGGAKRKVVVAQEHHHLVGVAQAAGEERELAKRHEQLALDLGRQLSQSLLQFLVVVGRALQLVALGLSLGALLAGRLEHAQEGRGGVMHDALRRWFVGHPGCTWR